MYNSMNSKREYTLLAINFLLTAGWDVAVRAWRQKLVILDQKTLKLEIIKKKQEKQTKPAGS